MFLEEFAKFHPILQAFFGSLFTWGVTALGAATVFFTKKVNKKFLDVMLGFAAGVMIAASFWSLLAPAIQMSEGGSLPKWLPPLIGFLLGGAFLRIADKLIPHLHLGFKRSEAEGIKTNWKGSTLMIFAITLHNIPEGFAVGVAFGAVGLGLPEASLAGAIALTLGIGLQNFPEGLGVSLPIRREGSSRLKSFFFGQLSGFVEVIAAVLGALLITVVQPLLPYALSFAAGAMIYVVVEEVIPESQRGQNTDIATIGTMVGFAVMMLLDVALG